MASEWKESTVGEQFDLANGFAFKSKDFIETGVPVIKIKNVKAGFFSEHDFSYVSPEFIDIRKDKLARVDDLLISMSGNRHDGSPETWVGKVARFNKANDYFINQRVGALRVKDDKVVNPRFASYLLSSWNYQQLFISIATSSGGQANLSPGQILGAPFNFPPLPEQKAIAHILGSLDDKIELNRRMNETLEGMAQALFKSWFVDFDPVIDNALEAGNPIPDEFLDRAETRRKALDDGTANREAAQPFPAAFQETDEMGWIPEGWTLDPLDSYCELITDGSHASPKSTDSGYPMASVKDMDSWGLKLDGCRKISEDDFQKLVKGKCKPIEGDVLIAKDGSYLKHIFVVEEELDVVLLSSIAILRPKDSKDSLFLALSLKQESTLSRMENYVSGAVLQRIILKDFKNFLIVTPPKRTREMWDTLCVSYAKSIWNNLSESGTLGTLRDTLLPKLISGELRVENVNGEG